MLVVFGEDAERLVELAAGFTGLNRSKSGNQRVLPLSDSENVAPEPI